MEPVVKCYQQKERFLVIMNSIFKICYKRKRCKILLATQYTKKPEKPLLVQIKSRDLARKKLSIFVALGYLYSRL